MAPTQAPGSPGPGLAWNARKRPLRVAAPGNASKGAAIKSPQHLGGLKRWIGGRAAPSLCPTASPEGWGHTNGLLAVWRAQRGQAVQGRRDAALAGVLGGSAPGRVPWRASAGRVGGAAAPGAWPMRAVVIRLILEDFSFSALSGNSWCRQTLVTYPLETGYLSRPPAWRIYSACSRARVRRGGRCQRVGLGRGEHSSRGGSRLRSWGGPMWASHRSSTGWLAGRKRLSTTSPE